METLFWSHQSEQDFQPHRSNISVSTDDFIARAGISDQKGMICLPSTVNMFVSIVIYSILRILITWSLHSVLAIKSNDRKEKLDG